MSALILDAGALAAVDREDGAMIARLRAAHQHGLELRTNAMVVAQVWRGRQGRQANLARLPRAVDVRVVSQREAATRASSRLWPAPRRRSMRASFCWPCQEIAS